jgi:TolB-like protein/Flp pilus assembly protein TadD
VRARRPEVRPALAQVVERAINPDPDRRFANADALARALSGLQGSTRRPLIPLALVAAALLAGIIGLEIHTRLTGDRRSFGTRLASALGFAPGYVNNPLIAVMPFRTFSGDPRDILLVENVTARLVQQLGIIDGLSVRSQTSSLLLKDKPRDLAEVGRRLNVNLVVEGDAQVSGSTLRINAALVSIDDRLVWSGKVERTLSAEKDIGEVVDELSRKIVDEFRLKLGRTQRRYETSIEIYETYLRGRAAREARLGRRNADAIPLFEEVIRRDPSFAPARAALAAAYAQAASTFPNARGTGISPAEAAARMTPLLQQAYDVDPMLGELHAAWGLLHSMTGEWKKAEASFRRAIELDPTITAVYGDFVLDTLLPWGRVDEAIATMQTALRLDPMSLDARRVLGRAQLDAGHFDAALENCTLVREQDPTYPFVDEICGQALMFKGRTDEALELFNKRADLNEQWIGYIYAITGRRAEAEAVAERNAHLPHRPAMIYSALGDYDRAFEALARLAAVNPRRAASFLSTAELAKLREDPRAAAFRQKLGFPR